MQRAFFCPALTILELVQTIMQIFVPNYQYNKVASKQQKTIVMLGQFLSYIFLFFAFNWIYYRIKNQRSAIKSSENVEPIYEGAINEKLKVLDMLQNQQQKKKMGLLVSQLYLRYSSKKMGIKELNFMVQKGTTFGLLGMNGSGKSTTIKLITNEIFKTAGNIYFDSHEINCDNSSIYQEISIYPQNSYLIEDMRVTFHLRNVCSLKGIALAMQTRLITQLAKMFDMEDCLSCQIRHLSGGGKRKVKLMSALIGRPKYIFLDEPTLGIDEQTEKMFGKMLMFHTEQLKASCILVTHKLGEVEKYCCKLGIMKRGGLILSQEPKKLVEQFSRGVQVNLYSKRLKRLQQRIEQIIDEDGRVFQCTPIEEYNQLVLLIPTHHFVLEEMAHLIIKIKSQGYVYNYDIRNEGFVEAFKYLITQAQNQLI